MLITNNTIIPQHDKPSTYDRINRVVLGYDQKLHRDDREHAKSRGLKVNAEVRWLLLTINYYFCFGFCCYCCLKMYNPATQPTKQPNLITKSINHSINQPTNHPITKSIINSNQPTHQPNKQPSNRQINQSINPHTNHPSTESISQSTNQPTSQPNQSSNQFTPPPKYQFWLIQHQPTIIQLTISILNIHISCLLKVCFLHKTNSWIYLQETVVHVPVLSSSVYGHPSRKPLELQDRKHVRVELCKKDFLRLNGTNISSDPTYQ